MGRRKKLVAAGGGSRDWTAAEREVILSTKNNRQLSSVMSEMGYTGHHINSVKGNGVLGGKWQGDQGILYFSRMLIIQAAMMSIYMVYKVTVAAMRLQVKDD
jgi:hypothetical protein